MLALIFRFIALTLALLFVGYIIPGIKILSIPSAIIAAVVIALVNSFIKPILMFLAFPINILTLGIFILFINSALFVAYLVPGLDIDGFWSAFLGAIVLSLLSIGISWI